MSKVRTSRKNERTFIWKGGGLEVWTRFVERSTVKKKKSATTNPLRCCCACRSSKSSIKCRKSLHDLEQFQAQKAGGQEVHACGCNRSIADIDWLLKTRLKALNRQWRRQALTPVRHCRSTPAARFFKNNVQEKKKKKKQKSHFSSTLSPCSFCNWRWTSREASLRETYDTVWAGCGEERG